MVQRCQRIQVHQMYNSPWLSVFKDWYLEALQLDLCRELDVEVDSASLLQECLDQLIDALRQSNLDSRACLPASHFWRPSRYDKWCLMERKRAGAERCAFVRCDEAEGHELEWHAQRVGHHKLAFDRRCVEHAHA